MTSRLVRLIFIALSVAGTIALAAIILIAIRPTQKPRNLPFADISKLAPGQWLAVDSDRLRFFVVRPTTGDVYAVAAPIDNGTVRLPEVYWWKPYLPCKDFSLEMPSGSIDASSRFRCRDAGLPEAWAQRWQWDARGKHLPHPAGKIDNLYGVRVQRDGDQLVFVGLEPD